MENLLNRLRKDYPYLRFSEGSSFCWSPMTGQIFYNPRRKNLRAAQYSVLHEVAHAVLGHKGHTSDYELLTMEVSAWEKARLIATTYDISIDKNYIQDCLDSYRDWLYKRSICPTCGNKSAQCDDTMHYQCFNCHRRWCVAASKFCRPYRHSSRRNKESPAAFTAGDSLTLA